MPDKVPRICSHDHDMLHSEADAPFMDQQGENEIVSGLSAGDPDAWRALYDCYASAIWQFVALRMDPQRAEVADVVQETLLAAAGNVRSYDPTRGSLWNWLTGIARRHIGLYYRAESRQDRIRQAADKLGPRAAQVVRWLENREPQPPDLLASQELHTLIRAALSELDRDYEELLTLKYLDGVSVEQIAGRFDSSATAIRSKLARARKMFRQVFTARCRNRSLSKQDNW
jgi:RNA polymerase sigma-70 factor (ECF subfamily)